MKRLFLLAGYDRDGVIGPSLIYYVTELHRYGDVVAVMDSDCSGEELQKLASLVLTSWGHRHGEYDFGSYKRAFRWAREALDMLSYDFCYLVNDSVFGPLYELGPYLESMERNGTDAFSMVLNPDRRSPHLQSWFMGFRPAVFMSGWFCAFMDGITRQQTKEAVCTVYETGLSWQLRQNGHTVSAFCNVRGKRIYNSVKSLYKAGLPFIKKSSFTRHNGSLGIQVKYVLDHADSVLREAVLQDAARVWGDGYIRDFLAAGSLETAARYVTYLVRKAYPAKERRISSR